MNTDVAMYYCYIGGPASGTSVPLGPSFVSQRHKFFIVNCLMYYCICVIVFCVIFLLGSN